jgi:hypothetical protein
MVGVAGRHTIGRTDVALLVTSALSEVACVARLVRGCAVTQVACYETRTPAPSPRFADWLRDKTSWRMWITIRKKSSQRQSCHFESFEDNARDWLLALSQLRIQRSTLLDDEVTK